jgi:CHAT domain-containing protein
VDDSLISHAEAPWQRTTSLLSCSGPAITKNYANQLCRRPRWRAVATWLRNLMVAALSSTEWPYPEFSDLVKDRVASAARGLGPDEQPFSHPMYWASFAHYGA